MIPIPKGKKREKAQTESPAPSNNKSNSYDAHKESQHASKPIDESTRKRSYYDSLNFVGLLKNTKF